MSKIIPKRYFKGNVGAGATISVSKGYEVKKENGVLKTIGAKFIDTDKYGVVCTNDPEKIDFIINDKKKRFVDAKTQKLNELFVGVSKLDNQKINPSLDKCPTYAQQYSVDIESHKKAVIEANGSENLSDNSNGIYKFNKDSDLELQLQIMARQKLELEVEAQKQEIEEMRSKIDSKKAKSKKAKDDVEK